MVILVRDVSPFQLGVLSFRIVEIDLDTQQLNGQVHSPLLAAKIISKHVLSSGRSLLEKPISVIEVVKPPLQTT